MKRTAYSGRPWRSSRRPAPDTGKGTNNNLPGPGTAHRRFTMTVEYQCSACEFMIRSEEEDELVEFVQTHASDVHDMSMSDADIRGGWTEV